MRYLLFLFCIIYIFLIVSCSNNNQVKVENKSIAAFILDQPIFSAEADNLAKQELYDQLYRIYIIRKTATEHLIQERLLELEAKNKK